MQPLTFPSFTEFTAWKGEEKENKYLTSVNFTDFTH
jgi:hypothetical protein